MKKDNIIKTLVQESIYKLKEWVNTVQGIGNQDAHTDRMLEEALAKVEQLAKTYEGQFEVEKNTYYIAFEQQGYEQLIVKVNAPDENTAYDIAEKAYLGDSIDRYIVEPENLDRYDCPIIDSDGYELDYSDCIAEAEEEEEED